MLDRITYPFRAAYNYVSVQVCRFFNYLAGKVNAVAIRIFKYYINVCKQEVFQSEIELFQKTKAALLEIKPSLTAVASDLTLLSTTLTGLPNAIENFIQEKLPHISLPTDPLQQPEALTQITAQIGAVKKTAAHTANAIGSLFSQGLASLPKL